jgi:hypothetical protein
VRSRPDPRLDPRGRPGARTTLDLAAAIGIVSIFPPRRGMATTMY